MPRDHVEARVYEITHQIQVWHDPDPVFELGENAKMPTRGSSQAAGLDLYASENVDLYGGETKIVPTGLKCAFNPGWVALIWDRSGMGSRGFHRYAGVIDSDYRGPWGIVLHNSTSRVYKIIPGERIAQVLFQSLWTGEPREGVVEDNTERGGAGWGSTGG